MFKHHCGLEELLDRFVNRLSCYAIVFQVIGKKYIEGEVILFGPGMNREMGFSETNHASISAVWKIVVDFTNTGQVEFIHEKLNKTLESTVFKQPGLIACLEIGNDV